ncbi:hypothetical protein BY996DRAFT_6571935 [Phakopsora pachyrhizi]|nr:hypothetical protein BY996DRAFT_6571935 [Phakopsora pachyrhizi]
MWSLNPRVPGALSRPLLLRRLGTTLPEPVYPPSDLSLRSNPPPSNLTITQSREPINERSAHPRKIQIGTNPGEPKGYRIVHIIKPTATTNPRKFPHKTGLPLEEDFTGHLNPIQILKSYKDYRFEVGERWILNNLKTPDQRDKRSVESKRDEFEDKSEEEFYLFTKEFDRYFEREEVEDGDNDLGVYRDFEPVDGLENLGELVDSRHMVISSKLHMMGRLHVPMCF